MELVELDLLSLKCFLSPRTVMPESDRSSLVSLCKVSNVIQLA